MTEPARRPTVLVVDDNEPNRVLVAETLTDDGCDVVPAASGAEALAVFARERPDLVLLDVRMPGLDGFATLARLRELPGGAETPVVFLTAQRDLDTWDRAQGAGADDYLTKPVRPAELCARVQTLLRVRRLSAEVQDQFRVIRRQRDDLVRLSLQKEQLAAFVVHDLKNPVHVVALNAHLLDREKALSAVGRNAARVIGEEAQNLTRLIMNLLDISRGDEGELTPRRAPVDVRALLAEVAESACARAEDRGQRVAIAAEHAPHAIDADPDLLRRVLENLLDNALRYGPEEGIITLGCEAEEGGALIRVADTGPGIPAGMRERIFDKFVQLEEAAPEAARTGRGLGLVFCRLAVEAHGGTIHVDPDAPGTVFCVRLPARAGGGASPPPARRAPERAELDRREAVDLHEHAPYGLHSLDASGTVLQVNATWLTWMGYAREEVEGRLHFEEVLTPESVAAFRRAYPVFKVQGEARDIEFVLRRKDGSTFPVLLSATAVRDADGTFVRSRSVILDLTERKRAEQAAELLRNRLADAIEAIQDPIAIFDAADRLVLCNSAYRTAPAASITGPILGLRFEEMLDASLRAGALDLEGLSPEAYRERRLAYRAAPAGAFEVRMADGRAHRVFERRTIEGGTVSVIWDVTDDVRREVELREARRAADAANAAKSEFLSSMSHELRTPLNAILGFAQLLARAKDPPLDARQIGWVKHVLRGGEHLLKLIDEVLDLAKIESGAVPMSPEPVGVGEVLREVLATLGPMAQARGVALRLAPVPPDLPAVVADRTRFSQILINYGSNAIKYNRAGGSATFVAAPGADGHVRVTVADTGLGIAPEKQADLFRAFHRLGQEAGPIEGTGIGLAITKRIAERMGGAVGARSVPGEGSSFWVELPAHTPAAGDDAAARVPTVSPRPAPPGARRVRVLYVEDNPANVALMQALLGTLERYELLTAPTAEIGLELARAHRPDLIVLDINLPGMSGYDAIEHLREMPETRATPVLALSASASDRDVRRALGAGFARYLTKPVQIDALLDALEQYEPAD